MDQTGWLDTNRDHVRRIGPQPHEIGVCPGSNGPEWSPSGKVDRRFHIHGRDAGLARWEKFAHATGGYRSGVGLVQRQQDHLRPHLQYRSPALKALDVATGAVRTLAEYHIGFQPSPLIENSYTGSIRISLAPDGKSVAVGTATSQADVWILDGALK